jgi:hypothetical protein
MVRGNGTIVGSDSLQAYQTLGETNPLRTPILSVVDARDFHARNQMLTESTFPDFLEERKKNWIRSIFSHCKMKIELEKILSRVRYIALPAVKLTTWCLQANANAEGRVFWFICQAREFTANF